MDYNYSSTTIGHAEASLRRVLAEVEANVASDLALKDPRVLQRTGSDVEQGAPAALKNANISYSPMTPFKGAGANGNKSSKTQGKSGTDDILKGHPSLKRRVAIRKRPRVSVADALNLSNARSPAKVDVPAALPPVFAAKMRERLQQGRGHEHEAALRWYMESLTTGDIVPGAPEEHTDLEKLWLNDKSLGFAGIETPWVPRKSLGAGAYGDVVLWEREMGANRLPARLACKDAKFDSWFQDYSSEAQLTRRVNQSGCKNVVKVLDWLAIPDKQVTRILYEFCPHGTLSSMMNFAKGISVTVPEAFIWHVFHSLASAVSYNAFGSTDGTLKPEWQPIIHRDIKPGNILLDEPDPNVRNLYPTLKLADYGLAYSIPNEAVAQFKRAYWSGGTTGYAAPEINSKIRSDPFQAPHPWASPKSDIYSIGCVILNFLLIPIDRYTCGERELLDLSYDFAYEYYPYSRALVDLACKCVRPDAEERPDVLELFNLTRAHATSSYRSVYRNRYREPLLPAGVYVGMALWTQASQSLYEENGLFRITCDTHLDWFLTHPDAVARLAQAAEAPGLEALPADGYVALGNGLGGFAPLAELEQRYRHLPHNRWLGSMRVLDGNGKEAARHDGGPFLCLLAQDRMELVPPDLEWKQKLLAEEAERRAQWQANRLTKRKARKAMTGP